MPAPSEFSGTVIAPGFTLKGASGLLLWGNGTDLTTSVGVCISPVSPEGVIAAIPGALCIVSTPGIVGLWQKQTGTGSTGWSQFPASAGSGKGNLDLVQAYFDFSSSADITLGLLSAGDTVEDIKIEIFTGFNGASPALTVGNPGDHAAYLGSTPISVGMITPAIGSSLSGASIAVHLYLSLGGSTTGAGRCAVTISRA